MNWYYKIAAILSGNYQILALQVLPIQRIMQVADFLKIHGISHEYQNQFYVLVACASSFVLVAPIF